MVEDFSQGTNTLYPSYEDEEYWKYLLEEAEWYEKSEDIVSFFQQNEQDENSTGMDETIQ